MRISLILVVLAASGSFVLGGPNPNQIHGNKVTIPKGQKTIWTQPISMTLGVREKYGGTVVFNPRPTGGWRVIGVRWSSSANGPYTPKPTGQPMGKLGETLWFQLEIQPSAGLQAGQTETWRAAWDWNFTGHFGPTTHTSYVEGTVTRAAGPPPAQQQQGASGTQFHRPTTVLRMRFNPKTGKVEVIKNGIINHRGFMNFQGKKLNRRQSLRSNYRFR